jgi:hypothetical protein
MEKFKRDKRVAIASKGAMIFFKLRPEDLSAVSSKDLLSVWKKRSEAIKAEMGIAIGKIVGIW